MKLIFSGVLKINSYVEIQQSPMVVNIQGVFSDNTGTYSAADIRIGDVIYINDSSPKRFIVQQIVSINKSFFQLDMSYDQTEVYSAPSTYSNMFIGRKTSGILYIPDAGVHQLQASFITQVKLMENSLESNLSFESATEFCYDIELERKPGFANIALINEKFVVSSLEIFVNGIFQNPGQTDDYVLVNNEVQFLYSPYSTDTITANFMKLF